MKTSSKRIEYCCILFFFISALGWSQEDFFFGQLVDSTRNEPIPFASIVLKNRALGVISNVDGTFKVPLKYEELGDTLRISSMGYESKKLSFKDLVVGKSNVIVLRSGALELDEAVVSANIKKFSPKQLVRIAVNSISQNYPIEQFQLVGYYRDYQVKNGEYSNLNEAIIKTFDKGFEIKDNFSARHLLYSYSKNAEFEIDSFAQQPYDYEGLNKIVPAATLRNSGGNEFITLSIHDAIRNYGRESFSFVDQITSDFIDNHNFRINKKTVYNDQVVYDVGMTFRNQKYVARGTIFINSDDFAIHKLDYNVMRRKRPGGSIGAINENERFSDGFKKTGDEVLYHIQIEYVKGANDKMFLNYISFYNKILIQRPAPFKSKFYIDANDRSFKLRMNKVPGNLKRIRKKDFIVTYKKHHLPIDDFYFLEDERTFVVCPDLKHKSSQMAYNALFNPSRSYKISSLEYGFGNIKDDLGNRLDERKLEYMHQYREFFTQEVLRENDVTVHQGDLMLKKEPLNSPNQPIVQKGLKNSYWMNTPLKGKEN